MLNYTSTSAAAAGSEDKTSDGNLLIFPSHLLHNFIFNFYSLLLLISDFRIGKDESKKAKDKKKKAEAEDSLESAEGEF